MISYMDYIQKCFYSTSHWNIDNLNENITATSDNIIKFSLPKGFRFDVSSNSTEYNYSSFSFTNTGKLSGSLAYLYCSKPLKNVIGSKSIPLQTAINSYRIIEPTAGYHGEQPSRKESLLYGKMYFPTRALEAMYINRFSPTSQFILKCINLPKQTKQMNLNTGIMTFYLQNDFGKYSREFIFSTNEALIGFRFLYNFGYNDNKYRKLIDKNLDAFSKNFHIQSSILSVGTEFWYGAMNMSPGFSSTLRYTTHSTSTGKPLTLTLSCNPILGNISSSYSVRTSVSSAFSSRYDFNIYSYESNLCLGCELWQLSRNHKLRAQKETERQSENEISHDAIRIKRRQYPHFPSDSSSLIGAKYEPYDSEFSQNNDVIRTFSKLVNESDFSSVIKLSTSLLDKDVKLLWEGKFSGFLLSGGCHLDLNKPTFESPVIGLQIQYSS